MSTQHEITNNTSRRRLGGNPFVPAGLFLALLCQTAAAQQFQLQVGVDPHGRRTSSLALAPTSAAGGAAIPGVTVTRKLPGGQTIQKQAPFSPGAQNTAGSNATQYKSFTSPGASNTSSQGWQTAGAWGSSNPSPSPWASTSPGWSSTPSHGAGWGTTSSSSFSSKLPPTTHAAPVTPPPAPTLAWGTPGSLIVIRMPKSEVLPCGYALQDGSRAWNYVMQPGQAQRFEQDRDWTIVFHRGRGFGERSYTLPAGEYEFRQTPHGWDLFALGGLAQTWDGPAPPQ